MTPDIAVVGAGIVGCLVAREIVARAPDTSVVVLDRDAAGGGASARSAGLHFPRGATGRVRRMAAYSQDYYEALLADHPELPIFPVPMVVVAAEADAGRMSAAYLERAGLTRASGVPGEQVEVPDGAGVWSCTGAHHAAVGALTQALARELRTRASVREGVRVQAVELTGDGVTLTLGTGEHVHAARVVLAPGPWLAAPAWRELVAPLGARVKKVVALHVEQQALEGDPVIVFHDEDAFLLPLPDRGHWLFSYTSSEWDVDPDTPADGLSPRDVADARATLRRYSPALAERCTAGRVFCDAYSGTGEPQVRALDSAGRVVFAGAANGSGYRLAPAIAAEAVAVLQPFPLRRPM